MATFCQIEVDLGVICSCMPSLPALFRPLIERLKGKKNLSTDKRVLRYSTPWSRRTGTGQVKTFATSSAASYPVPSPGTQQKTYEEHLGHRTDYIQTVTTIDQTYWRNNSDDMMLHGGGIELGSAEQGYVRSQAWAGSPGVGFYAGSPKITEEERMGIGLNVANARGH